MPERFCIIQSSRASFVAFARPFGRLARLVENRSYPYTQQPVRALPPGRPNEDMGKMPTRVSQLRTYKVCKYCTSLRQVIFGIGRVHHTLESHGIQALSFRNVFGQLCNNNKDLCAAICSQVGGPLPKS